MLANIRLLNRASKVRVSRTGANPISLHDTTAVTVDLDDFQVRQSLGHHSAVGQWVMANAANLLPVFNVKDPIYGATGNGTTDDTAAINAAITAYNAAGGGILAFPPGTYLTQGGHTISAPGVIRGAGYGTIPAGTNGVSVLYLVNNANTDLLTLSAKAITVTDLGLYGNITNQSSTSRGIVTSASVACNYFRFLRVYVDSFHDDGIYLQGPGTSLEGMSWGLRLTNNGAHGVNLSGGSAADCQFTDVICATNVLSGAYVNATDAVFTNCHMWGNGTSTAPPTSQDVSGLFMPSGAGGGLRCVSCYFESNGNSTAGGNGVTPRGVGNQLIGCNIWQNRARGVYAFSNTNLVISGSVVRNNNINNAAGSAGAGILYDTCTTSSVVGCQLYDTQGTKTQTYGYAENGNTCNACLFNDNVSRAADHKTGNWLIGTGNPTATIPSTPANSNVG